LAVGDFSLAVCLSICLSYGSNMTHADDTLHGSAANDLTAKRLVTIADSIRMTQFADSLPGHFSLDGKKLIVLLKKGNLQNNAVDYSILLWNLGDISSAAVPETLLSMASSSNRPAIEDITWLADNETVVFLGENPGELHQVFTFNTSTRILKKVTRHPTNILAYSTTATGERIAYTAETVPGDLWDEKTRREGITVSTQFVLHLLEGKTLGTGYPAEYSLFVCSRDGVEHALRTHDAIRDSFLGKPTLSPDGKFIVVGTQVTQVPETWKDYSDPNIRRLASVKPRPGQSSWLERFELVNTIAGESRFLLDSPIGVSGSDVAWSPDSQSVVMTRVFLPLERVSGEERKARQLKTLAVEVNVSTGDIAELSPEDLYGADWNPESNCVTSHVLRLESNTELGLGDLVFLQKTGERWKKAQACDLREPRPTFVVAQDMNTPPKIVEIEPQTHQKRVFFDPNPQFKELRFADVEEIEWQGTDGHNVRGGLYYPVNYRATDRYPLVIQTHGWSAKKFMIDGPDTTGYAAQALASQGVLVLQADDSNLGTVSTLEEAPREMAAYQGAIDHLDRKGLIDRSRVGIMGFSRSCLYVKYTLTHSKYHFAAASVTDGTDGGYVQYIDFLNLGPNWSSDGEGINGGPPWGEGLRSWFERSPGFNVDKVQTPVRIVALNPGSLLAEWEWFALLTRMGKTVEMTYLQDGSHELVRPWDRVVSQQGNVDWFCFWLKGEEDRDPTKGEQYGRWRELRTLQGKASGQARKPGATEIH
jgi:hypothetical protein